MCPAYAAGRPVSRNSEAEIIDVLESAMVHPTHADGFVDKDDPVYAYLDEVGPEAAIVGVARRNAAAATDHVGVERNAVYDLTVDSADGTGDTDIAIGDPLYLTTAAIIDQNPSGVYFGRALAAKTGSATPSVIPVEVVLANVQPTGKN